MIEQLKGQMSIEEVFGPDIWSGKTCPEPLVQTKAKTSEPSSKKQRESSVKMPLFLDLRGASGVQAVASWVTGGVLLGEFTMHSFGECPSVENVSLLSQILEENPLPKYSLSARACAGILRRAEKRGKKLPELLEETLRRQSASKSEPDAMGGARESSYSMSEQEPCPQSTIRQYCLNDQGGSVMGVSEGVTGALRAQEHGHQPIVYGISSYDSNAMKSSNPNSGIYEAKTTRTLDLNGGNPACNQGGMLVLGEGGAEPITASKAGFFLNARNNGKADTLVATDYKDPQMICYGVDCYNQTQTEETSKALNTAATDSDHIPCVYGIDRASFNQGQNAQYDFSVTEEQAQTLVAKGPGGVLTRQSVPYVPEITKE